MFFKLFGRGPLSEGPSVSLLKLALPVALSALVYYLCNSTFPKIGYFTNTESSRSPFETVMKPAHFRPGYHLAEFRMLSFSWLRGIHAQSSRSHARSLVLLGAEHLMTLSLDSEVGDSSEAGFSCLPQKTFNIRCWLQYLNINADGRGQTRICADMNGFVQRAKIDEELWMPLKGSALALMFSATVLRQAQWVRKL